MIGVHGDLKATDLTSSWCPI